MSDREVILYPSPPSPLPFQGRGLLLRLQGRTRAGKPELRGGGVEGCGGGQRNNRTGSARAGKPERHLVARVPSRSVSPASGAVRGHTLQNTIFAPILRIPPTLWLILQKKQGGMLG